MKSNSSRVTLAAIVVLLLVVTNPEVRALLLLTQALGAEVLLFMVWVQARSFWPLFETYAHRGAVIAKVVIAKARYVLRACMNGLFPREELWLAATAAILAVKWVARAILMLAAGGQGISARQWRGA